MTDVMIIGGGFAGVWASVAAARERALAGAELEVTLIAPGDDLVIRPRLYETDPARHRVPLSRILEPIGVRHARGRVEDIDVDADTVAVVDGDGDRRPVGYRRLVLAAGSRLRRPSVPGAEHLHDVDDLDGAVALERHLHRLPAGAGRFTAVVVGAGFTGLEVATELVGRLGARARALTGRTEDVRVVLVEQADVVGPDLGANPRPRIEAALDELGVEVRTGRHVVAVGPDVVTLDDDTTIAAATTVWTAGIQASSLTGSLAGPRDRLGRLLVDDDLRAPHSPRIFAAGDTAAARLDPDHTVMPSCQHAIPLGKFAGHNAAADLLGRPTAAFATTPYVTCLDLGAAGALFTHGFDRFVEMTGDEAKDRKRLINGHWIQPPTDDAAAILRAGDIRLSTRDAACAA